MHFPKITLAEKEFGDETRVVFAGSISIPFINQFIIAGCRQVLFSYWYLRELEKKGKLEPVFKALRRHAKLIYIDSGVFSFYKKLGVPRNSKKLYDVPAPILEEIKAKGLAKWPEFVKFTKEYVKFLNRWDKYFDYAFEMDVDLFVSVPHSDRLFNYIVKHYKNPRKIMRVWHWSRPFEDWQAWVDSGQFERLSVEGAGTHGRDPNFYKKFTDYAHKGGVKVHVLATTSPDFLRKVPCDTSDASTWCNGGRFGVCFTPFGAISFGRKAQSARHWRDIPKDTKAKFFEWMAEGGMEEVTEELLFDDSTMGVAARNFVNLYYFRQWGNKPVSDNHSQFRRPNVLEAYENPRSSKRK